MAPPGRLLARAVSASLLVTLALVGGCGNAPRRCTFSTTSGILNVRVRDARTHAPICDADVFAAARTSNGASSRFQLVVDADCVYSKSDLHIDGTYDLDVGHSNYEIGGREGVTLTRAEGECYWYANVEVELEPKTP